MRPRPSPPSCCGLLTCVCPRKRGRRKVVSILRATKLQCSTNPRQARIRLGLFTNSSLGLTRARTHTRTHAHTHTRARTHTRSRPPGALRVLSEAILLALEAIVPGLAIGLFQCRFSTSLQARQGSSQGLVKKRVQTCACPGLQACEQTRARGCRRKCTQRSLSEFLQERGEGWRMLRVQQGGTREGLKRCSHLFCQGGRKRERGRHRSSRPRTLNQSPLSDAISATPDVQTRQE